MNSQGEDKGFMLDKADHTTNSSGPTTVYSQNRCVRRETLTAVVSLRAESSHFEIIGIPGRKSNQIKQKNPRRLPQLGSTSGFTSFRL